MENLLDDFYHVGQACSILSGKPFDRPFVNALHCLGGESVDVSRLIALFVMLVSMFVFIRFLHPDRKSGYQFHFFALFHPIILFPYFYASQLSSAVTVAWAIGGVVFFFHKCQNVIWTIVGAFLLAVVGLGVRLEAPYILIMMTGSILVLFQSRDNLAIVETIKKYFHRENIIKTGVFFASFFCMKKLLQSYFHNALGAMEVMAMEQGLHYPLDSWYNSQVLAMFHYLQNFIFPFSHSFYGNWQEYVWIEQTFDGFFPVIIFLLLLSGLLVWSYRSRRLPLNLRLLMRGVVMFFLIVFVSSLVPRTEWYYPARGHLATVVLMGYLSVFVARLKRERVVALALSLYFLASMAYATLFQYKNVDNMYAHDKFFYGDVHPFLRMRLANREWNKGNREVAIQTWFNVYRRIPGDVAKQSNRAGLYKMLALYNGWYGYEASGRHEESSRLLPQLLGNTYFVSTEVCLQDSRVELVKCLEDRKKVSNFCSYRSWFNIPKLKQVRPHRIDMEPHCRKMGYKKYRR